jgi:hypothetical protein
MIGTTAAIIASAAIGLGGSLLAANASADASAKASSAQTQAVDKQIASNEKTLAIQREDQRPWREAGMEALKKLQTGIADGSFDPSNFEFTADPGYQFRKDQGQKAIERSASARGNLFSAGTQLAVQGYGQEFASNEYDKAYQRNAQAQNANFNALSAVAGTGQRATDVMTNATGNAGQLNNNAIAAGGNAIAQGYLGQGNAWAQGWQNAAGAANTGIQNYLTYDLLRG